MSGVSDAFTHALSQYLHGEEWKENIETFVGAHCRDFKYVNEFKHEHYDCWKSFKDIVEQILDMALSEVGGSIESLEKALDELVYDEDLIIRGPRDEAIKGILNQLMTYDSFQSFSFQTHVNHKQTRKQFF